MSGDGAVNADDRKRDPIRFDRHTPEYREQFEAVTQELQGDRKSHV